MAHQDLTLSQWPLERRRAQAVETLQVPMDWKPYHDLPAYVAQGFNNSKNNTLCCVLAVIQALLHHPGVVQWAQFHHLQGYNPESPSEGSCLVKQGFRNRNVEPKDIGRGHNVEPLGCLACSLHHILEYYWCEHPNSDNNVKGRSSAIQQLRRESERHEHWGCIGDADQQEDSGDVWQWLMDVSADHYQTQHLPMTTAQELRAGNEQLRAEKLQRSEDLMNARNQRDALQADAVSQFEAAIQHHEAEMKRLDREIEKNNTDAKNLESKDPPKVDIPKMRLQEEAVFVKRLFGLIIAHPAVCSICARPAPEKSEERADSWIVNLSLKDDPKARPKRVVLRERLDSFFSLSETLEAKCEYESCPGNYRYIRSAITSAPEMLCIRLLIYNDDGSKILTNMDIDNELDLSNHYLGREPLNYRLHAVVHHAGTLNAGHYTCYALQPDHTWAYMDDYLVERNVRETKAKEKGKGRSAPFVPYLLYYTRLHSVQDKDHLAIDSVHEVGLISKERNENEEQMLREKGPGADVSLGGDSQQLPAPNIVLSDKQDTNTTSTDRGTQVSPGFERRAKTSRSGKKGRGTRRGMDLTQPTPKSGRKRVNKDNPGGSDSLGGGRGKTSPHPKKKRQILTDSTSEQAKGTSIVTQTRSGRTVKKMNYKTLVRIDNQ